MGRRRDVEEEGGRGGGLYVHTKMNMQQLPGPTPDISVTSP